MAELEGTAIESIRQLLGDIATKLDQVQTTAEGIPAANADDLAAINLKLDNIQSAVSGISTGSNQPVLDAVAALSAKLDAVAGEVDQIHTEVEEIQTDLDGLTPSPNPSPTPDPGPAPAPTGGSNV